MEITVNLANRPFLDLRPILKWLRVAGKALAIFTLALGLTTYFLHQKAENVRSRVRAIEEEISRIHKERRTYQETLDHSENMRIRREADSLNEILDAKSFSWTQAMKDLETLLPNNLQVAAIEPIKDKDGTLTIHIRVLGPREKDVEFLSNLERSNRFLSPRIVGESRDKSEGGPSQNQSTVSTSKITEFDLFAEYNEDSPEIASPMDIRSSGDKSSQSAPSVPVALPHASAFSGTSKASAVSAAGPKPSRPAAQPHASAFSGTLKVSAVSAAGPGPRRPAVRPHASAISATSKASVVPTVGGVK